MPVVCAYCGKLFSSFNIYKRHLKIIHSKCLTGDKLVCGQEGCPLDYLSMLALQRHISRHHKSCSDDTGTDLTLPIEEVSVVSNGNDVMNTLSQTDDGEECEEHVENFPFNVSDEIRTKGAIDDAAHFVARLRSNPKIPLSVTAEIVDACKDMFASTMSSLRLQTAALLHQNDVKCDSGTKLLDTMSVLENPFTGLETECKQTEYFRRNGYYVAPHTFTIGQKICPVHTIDGFAYRTKLLTAEYVTLTDVLRLFLQLPGVLDEVIAYLKCDDSEDCLIRDFKDGSLWKNHPVRLKYEGVPNAVVIPVFDFFDDLETANPLGSHSGVHKIGCKYTIVKAFKPSCNSKLDNLILNMVFRSKDRAVVSNQQLLDIYLSEMSQLETCGFHLEVNGTEYQIFVCLVQVTGDNLGLNSILGFVESFTATYCCRQCKVKRDDFGNNLTESADVLRCRENYDHDVSIHNCSVTGIKEDCCYNNIPSFHVSQNVY